MTAVDARNDVGESSSKSFFEETRLSSMVAVVAFSRNSERPAEKGTISIVETEQKLWQRKVEK